MSAKLTVKTFYGFRKHHAQDHIWRKWNIRVDSVADHIHRVCVLALLVPQSQDDSLQCIKMALMYKTPFDSIVVPHEFITLHLEHRAQQTQIAKLVGELQHFEVMLQAYEHEKATSIKLPIPASREFTNSTVRSWVQLLESKQTILPDSGLNDIIDILHVFENFKVKERSIGSISPASKMICMTIMALYINDMSLDSYKFITMSIVCDLHKYYEPIEKLILYRRDRSLENILKVSQEFENSETPEAKLVHDFQACVLLMQHGDPEIPIEFSHPQVIEWAQVIRNV